MNEYSIAYGKMHYSRVKRRILDKNKVYSELTNEWEPYGERTIFKCSIGRVVEVYLNKQGKLYAYSKYRGTMYDGTPSPRYEVVLEPDKIDSTAFDCGRHQRSSFPNTTMYKGNEKAIELLKFLESLNDEALENNKRENRGESHERR